MNIVTKEVLGLLSDGPGPHQYSIEASQLGLTPGEWPHMMLTTLGTGQPLLAKSDINVGVGERLSVTYQQKGASGLTLVVYND